MFLNVPTKFNICNREEHLQYPWWKDMKGGGIIYLITLFIIGWALYRPNGKVNWYMIGYIYITFAISAIFFNYGTASIWCWLAVLQPLFTLV